MDDATKDTEQLDQQLSELLERIDATTTSVAERVSDESEGLTYADLEKPEQDAEEAGADGREPNAEPSETTPEASLPEGDIAPPGDTVVPGEGVTAPSGETGTPDPVGAEEATDGVDLEGAVEEMLRQAVDESDSDALEKAKALDEELARLGDELLARDDDLPPSGDIEAPDVVDGVDAPVDDGSVEADPVAAPTTTEATVAAPDASPGAPEPTPPATSAPTDAPAPSSGADERVPAMARRVSARAIALTSLVWRETRARAPGYWAAARPRALLAMAIVSKPIADQPPIVRSAIGWIAIVTAFWGVVVLVYVLAIRDVSPPPATEPSVELARPEASVDDR